MVPTCGGENSSEDLRTLMCILSLAQGLKEPNLKMREEGAKGFLQVQKCFGESRYEK